MTLTIILIPVISAFIGWFTNWIAIKLLFHPREPKRVLGVTLHGVFPKRQQQFAMKLGKLVSSELLSFADLEQKIANPENVSKILPLLESHIDIFLREKLTAEIPMIGMLIGEKTISQVKAVFLKELEALFPILMKEYMITLQKDLDLEKLVVGKVSNFSSRKVEEAFNRSLSAEFRLLAIIGAVLGFTIGLLQVLLVVATG